ncbi:hypothetical protein N7454_002918 [Penicillium verhagenii]|nr:hypothetical protein N7454_002918 [Penicillium verhagenii]
MESGGSAIQAAKLGVPSPMATSDGHPEDIDMDRPWTPLTPVATFLPGSLIPALSVLEGAARAQMQASPKNSKEGAQNPFAQLKGSKGAAPNPFAHLQAPPENPKEGAPNPFAQLTGSIEATANPFAHLQTQPKGSKAETKNPFEFLKR